MKTFKRFFLTILYRLAKIYWFVTKPTTLGARVMVFNENGQVLLIKHSYRPLYYFPGGAIERGESIEKGAAREVWEETGIKVTELVIHGIYQKTSDYKNDVQVILMTKEPVKNTEIKIDGIEIIDGQWFDLDKLPEDISPGNKKRIEEYQSDTKKVFTEW